MEAIPEAQNDSSGTNPSSVKSDDGSPPNDGRSSPPPNCAICLGRCKNKSFTDSCLHQFCFKCLVTWSKIKTECPLCKQNFKSIIHNVQSNQQYEEYRVEQRRQEDRIDIDDLVTATRRFRYRTTLTIPRGGEHTHITLQRLLMHYPPLSAMVNMSRDLPGITPSALPSSRRRRSPSSFRRTVYRHNLWARRLPDFTGRYRDCTPEFYRYNSSQMYRLVPWLNRELHYLLMENAGHIAYVLSRILDLLTQYHITSPEFREAMFRFFGSRTDHFLHELHCFASTPYDLTGYDRNVQYTTDAGISNTVNDISSSDTESGDSDIVLVTPPESRDTARSSPPFRPIAPVLPASFEPHAVTERRLPEPVYPQNHITSPVEAARLTQSVIPIETISHSDTDDDEVMVTGYIKPPNQRTPEVVDLRDSDDSDVVVTEGPPESRGYVKLTLSRPRARSSDNDSSYTPPRVQSARSSSSESSTSRTPSPPRGDDSSGTELSRLGGLSISPRSSSELRNDASRGRSTRRRRTRRSREAEREAGSATARRASSSDNNSTPERVRREKNKPKKCKSNNGKGVKSTRRNNVTEMKTETAPVQEEPRPGTSRLQKVAKSSARDDRTTDSRTADSPMIQEEPRPVPHRSGNGPKASRRDDSEMRRAEPTIGEREEPQGSSTRISAKGKSHRDETRSQRAESIAEPRPSTSGGSIKRKNNEDAPTRRHSRESKRLKSVVKKTSSWNSAEPSTSSAIPTSSSAVPASSTSKVHKRHLTETAKKVVKHRSPYFFSDSDDDIPLNLTIQRSSGHPSID